MQVLAFSESLARLVALLKVRELVALLGPIITESSNQALDEGAKEVFSTLVFEVSQGMTAVSSDPELRALLDLFPIGRVLQPSQLARLVTTFRTANNTAGIKSNHAFWELHYAGQALLQLIPLVTKLLIQPKVDVARDPSEGVLQLEVLDDDGKGIEIARFNEVLRSLAELHAAVSRFVGDDSQLRIAYGDSGSDFGLGLVAKKVTIDVIRSLFRDGWSHIRFWREVGFERRIETMGKGLQFVADVRKKGQTGEIEPEVARRVESAILVQMEKLMGNGVALREPIAQTTIPRRELIAGARNLKLLRAGDPSDDDDTSEAE